MPDPRVYQPRPHNPDYTASSSCREQSGTVYVDSSIYPSIYLSIHLGILHLRYLPTYLPTCLGAAHYTTYKSAVPVLYSADYRLHTDCTQTAHRLHTHSPYTALHTPLGTLRGTVLTQHPCSHVCSVSRLRPKPIFYYLFFPSLSPRFIHQ